MQEVQKKRGHELIVDSFDGTEDTMGIIKIFLRLPTAVNPDGEIEDGEIEDDVLERKPVRCWKLTPGFKTVVKIPERTTICHFGYISEAKVMAINPALDYTTLHEKNVEMNGRSCFLTTKNKDGEITFIMMYAPTDQLKDWQEWAFKDMPHAIEVVKSFT